MEWKIEGRKCECETVKRALALSLCRMPILALHVEAEGGLAVLPEKRDICRLSEHSFRTCWGGAAQQFLYNEATALLYLSLVPRERREISPSLYIYIPLERKQ